MTMTTTAPRKRGRPRKGESRAFWEGRLHELLLRTLPARFVGCHGRIDRRRLAAEVGLAHGTVGRWMNLDHMTADSARRLLAVSGATITSEDLAPFII